MSKSQESQESLPPVIVWGASGHASVVAEILRLERRYRLLGFLDDVNACRERTIFNGYTVFGSADKLEEFSERVYVIPGFGRCRERIALTRSMKEKGIPLATAIHPSSVISEDVEIGPGTVVVAGAVINPGVRIKESVIVNTSSSLDHDTEVGTGSHIAPGARVAGNVRISSGVWIGIGATIVEGVTIGAGTIIGAGSVVNRSIPDGVVAYGVPARIRREVE